MRPAAKLGLLACLYFSQGLPFGFFFQTLPAVLRKQHVSLQVIGLSTLLAIPWALKFLLGPFVDRWGSLRFGKRRSWILPLQVLASVLLGVLAAFDPQNALTPLLVGVGLVNVLAATQDVATDALAVDLLEPRERGLGNGVQVAGYRLGMILGGGVLLITLDRLGWRGTCFAMSAALLLATVPLVFFREPPPKATLSALPSLTGLFRRRELLPWLALLVLYKTGDAFGTAMIRPLLVDAGLDLGDIGWLLGTVGFTTGLVGALAGGALVGPLGRRRSLVWFGVLQALTVSGYLLVALWAGTSLTWTLVAVLAGVEQFAGGMATAALFTCMMDACRPEAAATDYTLQACAVVLATGLASALSGFSAAALGYPFHFVLSGLLTLAAALTILTGAWLPDTLQQQQESPA